MKKTEREKHKARLSTEKLNFSSFLKILLNTDKQQNILLKNASNSKFLMNKQMV